MGNRWTRRDFLRAGVGVGTAALIPVNQKLVKAEEKKSKMTVISSRNGFKATEKAMEFLQKGKDPLDAVIAGVNIVESDPNDCDRPTRGSELYLFVKSFCLLTWIEDEFVLFLLDIPSPEHRSE